MYECPYDDEGRHAMESSSNYYDHLGRDLGSPKEWKQSGPDEVIPFASVSFCVNCNHWLIITINLSYPDAIRWDNRKQSVDPGAKGGWSLFTGMEQITYRIEEEPTFGLPMTPTPAFSS